METLKTMPPLKTTLKFQGDSSDVTGLLPVVLDSQADRPTNPNGHPTFKDAALRKPTEVGPPINVEKDLLPPLPLTITHQQGAPKNPAEEKPTLDLRKTAKEAAPLAPTSNSDPAQSGERLKVDANPATVQAETEAEVAAAASNALAS